MGIVDVLPFLLLLLTKEPFFDKRLVRLSFPNRILKLFRFFFLLLYFFLPFLFITGRGQPDPIDALTWRL